MELKKLLQHWTSFPEISMEERPVLSSDLEKIVVKNPLSNAFYLRKKLVWRIGVIAGVVSRRAIHLLCLQSWRGAEYLENRGERWRA